MPFKLVSSGVIVLIIFGLFVYTYNKGFKSCASNYEIKILKAKLKNAEIALAFYKSAKNKSDKLAEEASKDNKISDETANEQLRKVDETNIANSTCVDDEFMRDLERIR